MQLKTILQTTRPPFLVLTPVCVFLGLVTAIATGHSIDPLVFALTLTGAVLAHASVNMLNEYHDFAGGLDFKTDRTQFSGGSGALPTYPEVARDVLRIAVAAMICTVVIGIYIMAKQGFWILPIGIAGLLLIATYTKWINQSPFLCLIAPGLGFGVLMVVGTHVALTGEFSLLPWLVSIAPFFLISNLLLLNQYPDVFADSSVGRNHFPIAYGIKKSNFVYGIFMLSAYLMIGLLIAREILPGLSAIALVPAVPFRLAVPTNPCAIVVLLAYRCTPLDEAMTTNKIMTRGRARPWVFYRRRNSHEWYKDFSVACPSAPEQHIRFFCMN